MTDHPDEPAGPEQPDTALPIDGTADEATQSMQMLMIAFQELNLLIYRGGFDLRRTEQYKALIDELGEGGDLPPRNGVYYLVYLTTGSPAKTDGTKAARRTSGEVQQPVLIPEGQVRPFVLAFALARDLSAARKLLYQQGMLPR